MNHKLIVFDWNGTLLADSLPSLRASNICLEFFGKPSISMAHFRETFTFPVIHFYTKNHVSVDEMLARKDESNVLFQASYERLAAKTRLRKGARELLKWLQERDYTCIILSNYMTDKIEAHLERLKIAEYFQFISAHNCDGTTILQETTKTARLSDYMVKRGFKPTDTVIIGDSAEEPDIARHLGLTSIGITDGCISRARLRKAKPDHIIHNLAQVRDIVV